MSFKPIAEIKALSPPEIKPKAPGERLTVPAVWRFGYVVLCQHMGDVFGRHKVCSFTVSAPAPGQALARLGVSYHPAPPGIKVAGCGAIIGCQKAIVL